ncbi:MAG: MarR family transcriptional regulator [Chloroflexi bacterium]|nr:MarR family transcriptional regulator [Chloroflexota bacterium]
MGTLPRLRRILLEFFPCVEGHLALTLPQFFALSCLYSGESLPSHLSRRLMVSKPTATVVVDGLVKRGLVERGAGPDDRRQVTLRLTPAGRRVCEAHRQAVEQRLCRAFAGLGTDELQRLLLALRDLQRVLQPDAQEKET